MAKKLTRGRTVAIATVLAIVLFMALNTIVGQLFPAQRVDLTASRLYSLSDGTRQVLSRLDDQLRFRFFVSDNLVQVAPTLSAYAARVRETLEAYARMSDGKITLEVIQPKPFSDDEDLAVGQGINQISVSNGPPLFFGMAATNSTSGRGAIPVFAPEREAYLEYDLTRLVAELGQRGKPRVALIDGLGLGANPMTRQPAQQVLDQMRQFFEIDTRYGDVDSLDANTRVLMVVHPQGLSARTRFTIDQWVLGGGATLIFVDPHAETQPGMQPGMPAPDPRSDLPQLFKAWGIGFDASKAVGDRNYALGTRRQVGGRELEVPNLPWIALRGPALANDDVVLSELSTILMTTAGALTSTREGVTLRPLLVASPDAGLLEAAQAGNPNADPRLLAANLEPSKQPLVLAARVEGTLQSAFPDGRPEGAAGDGTPLRQSKGATNLMIFGDADMLMDRNWIQQRQVLGQQIAQAFANNGDLVLNAIEQVAGGAVLAGLRGRGVFWRPFDRIEALQAEAQQKFLAKENELTQRLKQTEQRLRTASQEAGETAGGPELLSGERQQAVQRFRADLLATRAELREVQFNLNRDVDDLKRWISALNVAIWPLVVGIVVLMIALRRPRRDLPQRA
ncbi:MAG: GldG family protein [Burkholderiaceae bacterium]